MVILCLFMTTLVADSCFFVVILHLFVAIFCPFVVILHLFGVV